MEPNHNEDSYTNLQQNTGSVSLYLPSSLDLVQRVCLVIGCGH